MALFLDVVPGESILIGNNTRITVEDKTGRRTRLRIDAADGVRLTKAGEEASRIPADEPPVLRRPLLKLPTR